MHYDIDAKSNKGDIGADQTRQMLQALLAERFNLRLRRETRNLPVYALTVAKSGSKLRPPKPGSCVKPGAPSSQQAFPAPPPPGQPPVPMVFPCGRMGGAGAPGGSRMDGGDVPLSELVRLLVNQLHRPVIDRSSLKGTFDIHLACAGTNPLAASPLGLADVPTDSGPTIFDALQEQLGLKLESAKGPVEVLVIDSVQKPTEN